MKRYDCLRAIAAQFREEQVVTNIGAVRHEWQALRPPPGNYHLQNLGLTSSMALGLALALPHRKVVAFDGEEFIKRVGECGLLLDQIGEILFIRVEHAEVGDRALGRSVDRQPG